MCVFACVVVTCVTVWVCVRAYVRIKHLLPKICGIKCVLHVCLCVSMIYAVFLCTLIVCLLARKRRERRMKDG